jgi:FkbH-like protein
LTSDFRSLDLLASSEVPSNFIKAWIDATHADRESSVASRSAWLNVVALAPDDWSDTVAIAQIRAVTAGVKSGVDPVQLRAELRKSVLWSDEADLWSQASRILKRIVEPTAEVEPVVAVVGEGNLDLICDALRVAFFRDGIEARVWEPRFGEWRQQISEPHSELSELRPSVLIFVGNATGPYGSDGREFIRFSQRFRSDQSCETVIVLPPVTSTSEGAFINNDLTPNTVRQAIEMQLLLEEAQSESCLILLESGGSGSETERLWDTGKFARDLIISIQIANGCSALCRALFGRSSKVLAVDLDNTMWGGVAGEDGAQGLQLGPGSALGEGFQRLQKYVASLMQRGVILVAVSKNNPQDVEAVFDQRSSDMVLAKSDFVAIEASWDNKPDVLKRLVQRLNVGLNSVVFLDDNPAERHAMKQNCPEVLVIECAPDPWSMLNALVRRDPFASVKVTSDDRLRTVSYQARLARSESSVPDDSDYLASLGMQVDIHPSTASEVDRITQLVNKTNQFNLNGVRRSRKEIENNVARLSLSLTVSDRYENLGLVGYLCADLDDQVVVVDTWVLSCRAFGRKLEDQMVESLRSLVEPRKQIHFEVQQTDRNAPLIEAMARLNLKSGPVNPG